MSISKNKKLLIVQFSCFVFLLVSFIFVYNYMNEINNELSYKKYLQESSGVPYEEAETPTINISYFLIITMSISFILILESLYILMKKTFPEADYGSITNLLKE
ncbi:MAG: hypothetical protein ACOC56_02050 [Atribacterota bacterium]